MTLQPLIDAIAQRGDVVLITMALIALIGAALFAFTLRLLFKLAFATLTTINSNTQASTLLKASVDANTTATNAMTTSNTVVAQQLAILIRDVHLLREPRRR